MHTLPLSFGHFSVPWRHPPEFPPGQRLIAIDAILDNIFSFSTPGTIIALSKTCRAARPIAASYFRVAYNPERFLSQFFPDPETVRAFRTLQAETGLVVVGRAARNFLAREPLEDTSMQLYVDGMLGILVQSFLLGPAGYEMPVTERGNDSVYWRREDSDVTRTIHVEFGPLDSFDTVDAMRNFRHVDLANVITFDGAYSLFPTKYFEEQQTKPETLDEPPKLQAAAAPTFRSFCDRSSWVVSFDTTGVAPTFRQKLGTSKLRRDPLYTSSWTPPPPWRAGELPLRGIVLRSRLLRLAHVLCCVELSHLVQQLLTRLVLAHPERASSYFDAEVSTFLRACMERMDIRRGMVPYDTAWGIMKEMVPLPSDIPGAGGLQWPRKSHQEAERQHWCVTG
ncbi:hypothetical protein BC834DRAFT_911258 [Gloeopeniophorella convolvens]|nr:hypothetical protein BC834DRAFT_911258 [Gloeopeniophorella convolvens]